MRSLLAEVPVGVPEFQQAVPIAAQPALGQGPAGPARCREQGKPADKGRTTVCQRQQSEAWGGGNSKM